MPAAPRQYQSTKPMARKGDPVSSRPSASPLLERHASPLLARRASPLLARHASFFDTDLHVGNSSRLTGISRSVGREEDSAAQSTTYSSCEPQISTTSTQDDDNPWDTDTDNPTRPASTGVPFFRRLFRHPQPLAPHHGLLAAHRDEAICPKPSKSRRRRNSRERIRALRSQSANYAAHAYQANHSNHAPYVPMHAASDFARMPAFPHNHCEFVHLQSPAPSQGPFSVKAPTRPPSPPSPLSSRKSRASSSIHPPLGSISSWASNTPDTTAAVPPLHERQRKETTLDDAGSQTTDYQAFLASAVIQQQARIQSSWAQLTCRDGQVVYTTNRTLADTSWRLSRIEPVAYVQLKRQQSEVSILEAHHSRPNDGSFVLIERQKKGGLKNRLSQYFRPPKAS